MDFINELNIVINSELNEFKRFISNKMNDDSQFLEHLFWVPKDGAQMTVLNYLIHLYPGPNDPLSFDESVTVTLQERIDYILTFLFDKNIGEPLHQAIAAEKIQLALHLLDVKQNAASMLEEHRVSGEHLLSKTNKTEQDRTNRKECLFDLNRRDREGRTLISLVIDTKNSDLLAAVLTRPLNIHAATSRTTAQVQFQPVHQAVVLDFADGVRLLAHNGAQLANPFGSGKDTPVLLAARLGKMEALNALLEIPGDKLMLEAENAHFNNDGKVVRLTAIEELCNQINTKNKTNAIRGIAMLLCRGAEPPRQEVMCSLLGSNRMALLKAIRTYLEDKPQLVDSFVARCHLSQSSLHNIVYANHSWGNSIRHLFGNPCDAAFIVEELVVRKYSDITSDTSGALLSTAAAEKLSAQEDPLKLYALFVRRYTDAYNNQKITNCWSSMRWMIAEGQCDWETVLRYSKSHPMSRTRIIVNEMLTSITPVCEDNEESVEMVSCRQ